MSVKDYSTTPASNTSLFPENMLPSAVNNSARQMQADVRAFYEDSAWIDYGHAGLANDTSTTFTVTSDLTTIYTVGRRIRLTDSSTLYGTITASSYSAPDTTVTVDLDSGSISASLTAVSVAATTPNVLAAVYPVGAVYISTNSANPATIFGFGTWTALAAGRTLIGAGGGYTAGNTGGSADATLVSHSHTVTDPGHSHATSSFATFSGSGGGDLSGPTNNAATSGTASATTGISLSTEGSSATNANLPPYLVTYIWERTA